MLRLPWFLFIYLLRDSSPSTKLGVGYLILTTPTLKKTDMNEAKVAQLF